MGKTLSLTVPADIFKQKRKKKNKDQAFAEWVPTLPATGKYAVYVSYQTLPNSVSDAKYLVFHNGVSRNLRSIRK